MVVRDVTVNLRKKNQLTLPDAIAQELGVEPGDRLVMSLDADAREVRVRPIRRSYAGLFAGLYGSTPEEELAYIDGERASWGE
jgi:antitoxin component of MazEF toxin-antitoxin module